MEGIWYPSLRNKWVKCPVSHTISSLILTFFSESHLQQLWSWLYWWFSMFLMLYHLDFFCKEYLFLFLFSNFCKNPLIYVFYFILGFIIQYYCYSLYSAFCHYKFFQFGSCVPLSWPHSFFMWALPSLLLLQDALAYVVFSLPWPSNQTFLQRVLVP